MPPELVTRVVDLLKHGELIIAYRISYALVAQAMLVVSYTTLLSNGHDKERMIIELSICVFGLIFSCFQLILTKNIYERLKAIHSYYIDECKCNVDPIYNAYYNSVAKKGLPIHTKWMPSVLIGMWMWIFIVTLVSFCMSP
jgi:hypothetical protein